MPTVKNAILLLLLATPLFGGWSRSYKITVDHAQAGSSDSSNFPVLVNIAANADFKDAAHSGYIQHTTTLNGQTVPADLIVGTDVACATPVTAWEVASYDGTNGNAEIWVNQGTLSHTVDTIFYVCIGNSAVTTYQSTATSTWNSSTFGGVWHLANGSTLGNGTTTPDSTAGAFAFTINSATAVTGQIDGGASFVAASSQYLSSANAIVSAYPFTIEAWFNPTTNNTVTTIASHAKSGAATYDRLFIFGTSSSHLGAQTQNGTNGIAQTTVGVSNSTWQLGTAVFTTSASRTVYLNAGSNATNTTSLTAPAWDEFWAGRNQNGATNEYFNGSLDEVRIYKVAVSADWITAEYNMEKPSQTMVTMAAGVSLGGVRSQVFVVSADRGTPTKGLHSDGN